MWKEDLRESGLEVRWERRVGSCGEEGDRVVGWEGGGAVERRKGAGCQEGGQCDVEREGVVEGGGQNGGLRKPEVGFRGPGEGGVCRDVLRLVIDSKK